MKTGGRPESFVATTGTLERTTVKTFKQQTFREPPLSEVTDEPLVVHEQESRPDNDSLIIFVHGLGGKRYGAKSTWGNFPKFVFKDIPALDVGLYEYMTFIARWRFWKSIALEKEAEIFAQTIRDELGKYQTIILIGHSMGGLLCKALITELVDSKDLPRIGGLFLMATPQLGSTRVPRFLRISNDGRVLKAHSQFVARVTEIFEDKIYLDENINAPDRAIIPTWAVLGASDFWVDELSAGIGLSSKRKKLVHGSHTEIVKPKKADSPAYKFVKENIRRCLNRYQYDVFLASPMAALETEADYQRYRNGALAIEQALREYCGFSSIFYAGRKLATKAEFQAASDSLHEDYEVLQASRHFMLIYPERSASSVIFEAGMALAMGKPSLYVVNNRNDLPFLLQQAPQAFNQVRVKIYDKCPGTTEAVNLIKNNGKGLFVK